MKTGKIIMSLIAAASLLSMSCDIYEDGTPAKSVRSEFRSMYPEAKDVEWEREGKNWSVSFEIGKRPNVIEYEALYDTSGNWIMTENDVLLMDVPQSIKDFVAASAEYGSLPYADSDAEYYQTPAGDFYRLELNNNGREIEVDVTTDGKITLAKYKTF